MKITFVPENILTLLDELVVLLLMGICIFLISGGFLYLICGLVLFPIVPFAIIDCLRRGEYFYVDSYDPSRKSRIIDLLLTIWLYSYWVLEWMLVGFLLMWVLYNYNIIQVVF